MQLFNLLGDPLLRLPHPRPLPLELAETVVAGQRLQVSGLSQLAGRCTIELVSRRDRMKTPAPARQQFDPADQALAEFTQVYQQANDQRWTGHSFAVNQGEFHVSLRVPEQAHGACHVRVLVQGQHDYALGAANVWVRRSAEGRQENKGDPGPSPAASNRDAKPATPVGYTRPLER